MRQHYKHKDQVYFSRWSRKSYSLFACLGKEVIIGTLKYKLTDMGIKIKQGLLFLLNSFVVDETKGDFSETSDRFLQTEIIPCMVSSKQDYPAVQRVGFYRKYKKMAIDIQYIYSHFLFLLPEGKYTLCK